MRRKNNNIQYGHGKKIKLSEKESRYVAPIVAVLLDRATGKETAITSDAIARWINSTSTIQHTKAHTCPTRVRVIIRAMRAEGKLPFLIGSRKGYYTATNISEVKAYINRLKNRASETKMIALRMEMALREIETKGALILKCA